MSITFPLVTIPDKLETREWLANNLPFSVMCSGPTDSGGDVNDRQLTQVAECRRKLRSGEYRSRRLEAGLSLADVASAARIAPTTLWRYEQGRMPRPAQALALYKVFRRLRRAAP